MQMSRTALKFEQAWQKINVSRRSVKLCTIFFDSIFFYRDQLKNM